VNGKRNARRARSNCWPSRKEPVENELKPKKKDNCQEREEKNARATTKKSGRGKKTGHQNKLIEIRRRKSIS
jgi:hypothetical protein